MKRIITLIVAFMAIYSGVWADSRTKITQVVGSSTSVVTIPLAAGAVTQPTITMTTGAPAYFNINESNGWWQKKVDGKWQTVRNGYFTEGTWRFSCQVRIDSKSDPNNQYVLDKNVSVKVNGVEWEKEVVQVLDKFSYVFVSSPEITIAKRVISAVDATNTDLTTIPYVDEAIVKPTITVTSGLPAYFDINKYNGWWQKLVDGEWTDVREGDFTAGTWRFSCQVRIDSSSDPNNMHVLDRNVSVKVNGVEWEKEKVQVFDDFSYVFVRSPEITVKRKKIHLVEATSTNYSKIPQVSNSVEKKPTFTVEKGKPAYFSQAAYWEVLKDGEWTPVRAGSFYPGTWRYAVAVIIDAEDAVQPYYMAEDVVIKVNGEVWDKGVVVNGRISGVDVYSPSIVVGSDENKGDLNGDKKVDIADAVTVLNIMAAGGFKAEADLNGDGKIDIADFVTVLNIMAAQ